MASAIVQYKLPSLGLSEKKGVEAMFTGLNRRKTPYTAFWGLKMAKNAPKFHLMNL
jgi:hypothetical protein